MDITFSPEKALLLALASFVAGTIDAIAGGGGLITVPALVAANLPPHFVFGTNKGQSVFGATASLTRYWRAGMIDKKRVIPALLLGFSGSLLGARLLLSLKPDVLRPLVIVLLLLVAVFVSTRRDRGPVEAKPRTPARLLAAAAAALVIGAYDGFFGPGTGTFLIVAFVAILGESMQLASANAKVVNFASNLAAFTLFWQRGVIVWSYALPMAAANFAGGWLGAHLGVRVGDRLVRRVLVVVAASLVAKIAIDLFRAP